MSRIASVDVVRVLAILAVVALHTTPAAGPYMPGETLNGCTLLNLAERFAVPFFFILSGYFWAAKCHAPADYWCQACATGKRILFVFAAWGAVYYIAPAVDAVRQYGLAGPAKVLYWTLRHPDVCIPRVALEGTKFHLWFLPALMSAVLISGALLALGRLRTLCVLAALLFLVGLAGSAYADTPFGLRSRFNFRDGPFFSLVMFATGIALQRRGPGRSPLAVGIVLAVAGLAVQAAEAVWLNIHWGKNMNHDYLLGTYPLGLGVALIALSNARGLRLPALSAVGPLGLGIYACHVLYVELLRPLLAAHGGELLWNVGYVAAVFALSLVTTLALSKLRLTRRLVS